MDYLKVYSIQAIWKSTDREWWLNMHNAPLQSILEYDDLGSALMPQIAWNNALNNYHAHCLAYVNDAS